MSIAEIEIRNFMCFRGSHVLRLKPRAYAVVGRRVSNAESSNWSGKSAFCESVPFALEGWLNPSRGLLSDGWISDGEKEGWVRVRFDDGFEVTRSKKVGKREEIETSTGARQTAAEEEVRKRIGLDLDDLLMTSYLAQKQVGKFVLAAPGDRLKIVSGWFRLDRLEKAEEVARERLAKSIGDSQEVLRRVQALDALEADALAGESIDSLRAAVEVCRVVLARVMAEELRCRELIAQRASDAAAHARVAEYEEVARVGRDLQVKLKTASLGDLEANVVVSREVRDELAEAATEARRVLEAKRVLARGEFSGECPVAGIACPARPEINARVRENHALHVEAEEAYRKALSERERAEATLRDDASWLEMFKSDQRRFHDFVERARALKPIVEPWRGKPAPDVEEPRRAHQASVEAFSVTTARANSLASRVERVERAREERAKLAEVAAIHAGGGVRCIFAARLHVALASPLVVVGDLSSLCCEPHERDPRLLARSDRSSQRRALERAARRGGIVGGSDRSAANASMGQRVRVANSECEWRAASEGPGRFKPPGALAFLAVHARACTAAA